MLSDDWGANCVHGVQSRCAPNGRCATSFPNPNTLGASFNETIWHQMAAVIGLELRALWLQNVGENHASNLPHLGLDCWSPNIGILRDPRWGRAMEVPSEDPYLNGVFGTQYTLGLQNNSALDDRYLQAVVTLKHFVANSLEGTSGWHNSGITRHSVNAKISLYDLASTYLPAFQTTVQEGGAAGIMCSYNRVNGVPMCGNEYFLKRVLRREWKFRGYVTSDSGALNDFDLYHKYTQNRNETVALAIQAGCDVESAAWQHNEPWSTGGNYIDYLVNAVRSGRVPEVAVDQAVRNAMEIRFRLGLFDPIESQPFWKVSPEVVQSDRHVQASRDATAQGFVLLKNTPSLVPLDPTKKIALIGPHVHDRHTMLGNYYGQICPSKNDKTGCVTSFHEGFQNVTTAHGGVLQTIRGCEVYGTKNASSFLAAVAIAKESDVVVFLGGLNISIEAEALDRTDIRLPLIQKELIQALAQVNSNIVLVLMHGGMVALDDDILNSVASVVSLGYPGRYAGDELPAALFGLTDRGAWGKLAVTWYKEGMMDELDMVNFDMIRPPGRTYRYYTGEPQFEFGYGLNPLTSFRFENVQLHCHHHQQQHNTTNTLSSVSVTFTLRNVGQRAGDEVVLVYLIPQEGTIPISKPASNIQKQLIAFHRHHFEAQQAHEITLEIAVNKFRFHDEFGLPTFYQGRYHIRLDTGTQAIEHPIDVVAAAVVGDKNRSETFEEESRVTFSIPSRDDVTVVQ